jgi:hypothetical protein
MYRSTAGKGTLFGAVKLLGNQSAVPSQDRIGERDGSDRLQILAAERLPISARVERSDRPSANAKADAGAKCGSQRPDIRFVEADAD